MRFSLVSLAVKCAPPPKTFLYGTCAHAKMVKMVMLREIRFLRSHRVDREDTHFDTRRTCYGIGSGRVQSGVVRGFSGKRGQGMHYSGARHALFRGVYRNGSGATRDISIATRSFRFDAAPMRAPSPIRPSSTDHGVDGRGQTRTVHCEFDGPTRCRRS